MAVCRTNFVPQRKNFQFMTLGELNSKFVKAHALMGIGAGIGVASAEMQGLRHPLIIGILIGLLFSIHIYRKCIIVLIEEYKRLKSNKKDENKNIS